MLAGNRVIYFGHNLADYIKMFNLQDLDWSKMKVLDCAAGISSFTFEMHQKGYQVKAIDPLYQMSTEQLESNLLFCKDNFYKLVSQNLDKYNLNGLSIEEESQRREQNSRLFLKDLDKGKQEARYQYIHFPNFDLGAETFDLALCSHFLFTYTQELTLEFHQKMFAKLLGLAVEVRIFPLVDKHGEMSSYLGPLLQYLQDNNINSEILEVPHEFQKTANAMLVIDSEKCMLEAHQ